MNGVFVFSWKPFPYCESPLAREEQENKEQRYEKVVFVNGARAAGNCGTTFLTRNLVCEGTSAKPFVVPRRKRSGF